MDGLLLDTERIAYDAFRLTCDDFGLGDETPVFIGCIGTNTAAGLQVLEEGLAGKADHAAFDRAWSETYARMIAARPPDLKAGAVELLEYLSASGIPKAVATSTASERARRKLETAGIAQWFQAIIGGDQVARSKPHPEIYVRAAAALGVEPRECLALEDSNNGVRSALAAGMTVIQVPDLAPCAKDLARAGVLILPTLHAVLRHIDPHG
jgi:HAD superfamily hydrolase (TIGR01509 family)